MKNILALATLLISSIVVIAQHDMRDIQGMNENLNPKKDSVYYTCVMHPEIHAPKPGDCPKCGMTLIKKTLKAKKATTVQPDTQHYSENKLHNDSTVSNTTKTDSTVTPEPTHVHEKTVIKKYIGKMVRYDITLKDTIVEFGGKKKRAISANGKIPMPTLTFTEGDTAEIYVHNELNEESSIHWHGLFLPNQYDGVPNMTQMPIKPHTTHLYKFPIIQHGTHWYHSHSGLQEQIGMYGSFVMNKKADDETFRKGIDDLPTIPVVLSEWTNMNPKNVHRMLHNATDWFAIKKGTTQSYSEAISQGYLKTKITNEWKRMNAMDVSDVYYDKFLINGQNENQLSQFKAGDKVRLRIANGGASDYFWLTYSGGKITVVANDGNDVEPVEVDRLIIAVSETYDVVLTIPDAGSYEFLVTPEDRTASSSLWFGNGMKMPATPLPKLKYFEGMKMMNAMMKMNGDLDDMGMHMTLNQMDMNDVMYPEISGEIKKKTKKKKSSENEMKDMKMDNMQHMNMGNEQTDIITLNYAMLKSPTITTLPQDAPVKTLNFQLTGNMNRYVWSIDNKVVSEADKILIHKGENVRIIIHNNSMMRHPMHLHGHDFRLLNGHGDYAPLKNIVDIMPMETDTLEFNANVYGDWFFHCHILYHMMSGMGRVFTYENQPANPEIANPKLAQRKLFADDRKLHFMTKIGIETNGSDGEAMFAGTRWKFEEMWHMGYHPEHGYESETMFGRYLGKMQWWYLYTGFDYHYKTEGAPPKNFFDIEGSPKNMFGSDATNWFGQTSNKNNRHTGVFGIAYTLPLLIIADARIDLDGKLRFQLSREDIPLTKRLRMSWMLNTDKEYTLGFRYIATKYISVSTHYDSDMGFGAGLTFTY